jgi:prophage antirepressor-like protein
MTDVIAFNSPEFGTIRTVSINNEPWFVSKDVTDILGYSNGNRDIRNHIDEEDRINIIIFDGNQNEETFLINAYGLYSLIFGSKLESARFFKRWITFEVLPAIR